jgi:ubiquinone/menaquinone biosynthesis C-methylase UbiE
MNKINKIKEEWEERSTGYLKEYQPIKIDYGPGVPTEDKLKLIGSVKNKNVLDLGCGGGQISIAFAKKGARVTGIDLSEKHIEFAKKLAKKRNVKILFEQGSFQQLPSIKSKSQDIVFSSWAFLYSPDLGQVFKEVHRVLKKGGLFVFSQDHPFFHCFGNENLEIKQSYLKSGNGGNPNFISFRRTVSELFNALKESGFNVEKILEPECKWYARWKNEKYFNKKKIEMLPTTIIFKSRK